MTKREFPAGYFEHNGFPKIDHDIILGAQRLAQEAFDNAPFKTIKTNCVIVYKQNENLCVKIKKNHDSSIKEAKNLMEQGINSIIFSFASYPKIVKHEIVSDNPLSTLDYEGKGQTFVVDVRHIDSSGSAL